MTQLPANNAIMTQLQSNKANFCKVFCQFFKG